MSHPAPSWQQLAGESFRLWCTVPDEAAFADTVGQLVQDRVASRIAGRDATLWGPAAEDEAGRRLNWVRLSTHAQDLVDEIALVTVDLRSKGLDRVVLCGMGGSSLAPEVICAAAGVALDVLDSSDPDVVRRALADRLAETVVVVSSKSGGTVETDSQRRAYEHAFTQAGIDPAERIIVVTDPGSPLEQTAREAGYRVFLADPGVGGRYSALTAFGLVPSGLAGANIAEVLASAESIRPALEADSIDNPGLRLGALLGAANRAGAEKLVLTPTTADLPGFGDWAEQLIAESTGKDGRGILPVVVDSPDSPILSLPATDLVVAGAGAAGVDAAETTLAAPSGWSVQVAAGLGAHLLLWEYATAVASRLIGVNPFDQPDVESAKQAARDLLDSSSTTVEPLYQDGAFSIFASGDWLPDGTTTVREAVQALLEQVDPGRGYLSVQAYLDRARDAALAQCQDTLARRVARPVTFGWGPRFLHSTGQYHKGGPATGAYLQVTSEPESDLPVPGRNFTFHEFLLAQAVGDGRVLADHGRPVLRVHLASPEDLPALLRDLA